MKLKITLTRIIAVVLFILVNSCAKERQALSTNSHPDEKARLPSKSKIIAFCDMTSSLDSISIKNEAKKASELIKGLPMRTEFVFYPINDNTFSNNLYRDSIPYFKSRNKRKQRLYEKEILEKSKKIEQYIINNHDKTVAVSNDEYRSCIVSSLETVYQLLKTMKDKDNVNVVFFSDMIEQCPLDRSGEMYMCSNNKTPNLEDLIKQIEESYNPNFNLKELIGNRISIVVTTNKRRQENCLQEYERKILWQKIFEKVGYSKADFELIHFNQELPSSLLSSSK